MVAGGGGARTSINAGQASGGGGAGGVLYQSGNVTDGTGYFVTVGAGGAANGSGSSSKFLTSTAFGGGYGGSGLSGLTANGADGGSGGGSRGYQADIVGGSGTPGQGFAGGPALNATLPAIGGGGGGGGASQVGEIGRAHV